MHRSTIFSTYTGAQVDLRNPQPDRIFWPDIVVGLSHAARYGGHSDPLYTFAQHSVDVALRVRNDRESPDVQWEALMHDAVHAYPTGLTEAYVPESEGAYNVANALRSVIARKYGLSATVSSAVQRADELQEREEREIFSDPAIFHDVWAPPHARMMFEIVAHLILSERPHATTVAKEIRGQTSLTLLSLFDLLGIGSGAYHRGKPAPPRGGPEWEAALAHELRAVFARFGLDPGGAAFGQFIASLEATAQARTVANEELETRKGPLS